MALLLVLWIVALIALLTVSAVSIVRGDRLAASASLRVTRAQWQAEAGIVQAIAALLDPRAEKRWIPDGRPYTVVFDGVELVVTIQDEFGKLDLNTAPDALLIALLQSAGLARPDAEILLNKIADWRDPDDLRRLNGAEGADYRAMGFDYGPRNAPFRSIEELMLVMGMTPEVWRRIGAALTLCSRQPAPDLDYAPPEILMVVHNVNRSQADAMVRDRRNAGGSKIQSVRINYGRCYAIRAAPASGDGRLGTERLIRLTGSMKNPYMVLSIKNIFY